MPVLHNIKKYISSILNQKNLTHIASLNAIASILDYIARLLVAFFVTPLLVRGLGDYFFGMWQILNRFIGYISPTAGRSTQALKFALANAQSSKDYDHKRGLVGSAFVTWLLFVPLTGVAGGVLVWFIPIWLKAEPEYYNIIRSAAAVLVANVTLYSISILPQSVLQGENLGYKRMGLSPLVVFFGGGLTWLALFLDTGIVGVSVAAAVSTLASGVVFLLITRRYAEWFGIKIPPFRETKQFISLSGWFIAWNLIMSFITASDVVILGILASVESVTDYTLTKYAPEILITMIAIMVTGMAPGLGGIIGAGNHEKAYRVRQELMFITWLVTASIGSGIILWNRTFIALWVGPEHFSGILPTLLIVIIVTQLVFIRNDANIIDLTLKLSHKVLLGGAAVILTILLSILFVRFLDLGITGLCIGIILGRAILSFGYPIIINRFFAVKDTFQLNTIARPASVSLLFFIITMLLERYIPIQQWRGITGWIYLIVMAGLTAILAFVLAYFLGLSRANQTIVINRIRALLNVPRKKQF